MHPQHTGDKFIELYACTIVDRVPADRNGFTVLQSR